MSKGPGKWQWTDLITIVFFFLLLIFAVAFTLIFGALFRAYPAVFFVLGIVIPTFATVFRHSKYKDSLSKKASKWIRIVLVTSAIAICSCALINLNTITDEIGYQNIKGYHSEWCASEDYETPLPAVIIHTSHWSGKFLLWVFQGFYCFLCIAAPIVTWKQCSIIYDKARE